MPTTDTSSETTTPTGIYDIVVVITLQNTDREIADEFVAARDVRELDSGTIEVTQDVVARTDHEAYRCGVNLVSAILDAAGLVDQYNLGDVRLGVPQ
jgi:6-phosphogluconate dehydrogenase